MPDESNNNDNWSNHAATMAMVSMVVTMMFTVVISMSLLLKKLGDSIYFVLWFLKEFCDFGFLRLFLLLLVVVMWVILNHDMFDLTHIVVGNEAEQYEECYTASKLPHLSLGVVRSRPSWRIESTHSSFDCDLHEAC